MTDADEMRELLTYANYAKVAAALRVSRNAVSAWARGKDVTPYRVRQVRDLLRPPQPQPPATSTITRRLLAGIMALERQAGVNADEAIAEATLFEQKAQEMDRLVAAELSAPPEQRTDEAAADRDGGQSAASPGSRRRVP